MAVGTVLRVVEDGTQAEFGLERAEHGLHVGEGDIGTPQGLGIEVEDVGTQAADPRVAHRGSLGRPEGPRDGESFRPFIIGSDGNLVVPGETGVGLLKVPDAALDRPKQRRFSSSSATASVEPSIAIRRCPRYHAPTVDGTASGCEK